MISLKRMEKLKMKDRFDLEQHIMECWNITSDVDMLIEAILDSPRFADMPADYSDRIANMLIGTKELYEMRFERLWATFEDCITAGAFDAPTETVSAPQQSYENQLSFNYEYKSTDWNNWNNFTMVKEDHDYNEQQ